LPRALYLIKPSRLTETQPFLLPETVVGNMSLGIETSVVLDLNILSLLREAVDPSSEMLSEERKLAEIQSVFNIPFLFLSPGMALGEADESYLESLHSSFEKYLEEFCPGYVDAKNATHNYASRERSRRYSALSEIDQQMFSVSYLALLKIHDILLSQPSSSGEAKFDIFLEYMDGVANFVPALEAEVAKFCFVEKRNSEDPDFVSICKAIKDNFNKGGRGNKRIERVLNGARDVMYLRATAMMDGKRLDGNQQDTWLLTCDHGIASLARAVYFYPTDGEASKYVTYAEYESRARYSYWRYVDAELQRILLARQAEGRSTVSSQASPGHLSSLADKARELEQRVASHEI